MKEKIDSNFPFEKYRSNQYNIIENIYQSLSSKTDNYVLEAPTATGKSVIAYTAAKTLLPEIIDPDDNQKPNIIICTLTKQLQHQYINSFSNQKDTSYIYSSQNYPCKSYPELNNTEDACYYGHPLCPGQKCIDKKECKYLIQKSKFLSHKIGITNYHYFLTNKKLICDILILDECHELEKLLANNIEILLSSYNLIRFTNALTKLKIKNINSTLFLKLLMKLVKSKKTSIESIEKYITNFIDYFEPLVENAFERIEKIMDKKKVINKQQIQQQQLLTQLSETIDKYKQFLNSKTKWIISEKSTNNNNYKITVKPVDVYEFFEKYIANRTKKIIFMSATICGPSEFTKNLGITDYKYLEVPATIPISHRRIYFFSNLGNLNYKNKWKLLPIFVEKIDEIIKYHRSCDNNVNGIIHSVSYENAEYIKNNSKYKDDIIIPTQEEKLNINLILNKGKKILVSPSMILGIDLPDDLSRFQILLKVPYLNLGNDWVKYKLKKDQKWYARNAIMSIIQCAGRSVRSIDDFAYTYILDSNFSRLLMYHQKLFPKYFLKAIKYVN